MEEFGEVFLELLGFILFILVCALLIWFFIANAHDVTCFMDELFRSVDYSC